MTQARRVGPPTRVGVYSDLGRYGAGRVMATIASGLIDLGTEVRVLTANRDALRHPLADPRWRLVLLPDGGFRWPLAFWRHLRRLQPSALILADRRFAAARTLVARLACPRCRLIVVLHSDPQRFLAGGGHMTPWRLLAWRAFLALALRVPNRVVTVSDGIRQNTERWLRLPPRRMLTVGNPVLSPALLQAARQPCGHQWLDAGDRPVVIGVGRLSHEKDWATLVRAFSAVRRAQPARLVLVGEGPERPALEGLVRTLDLTADVLFVGEVADPYPYIARASVLGHTSTAEGLPTVLIEALALGVPVVATDCPFGPAEILGGGRWGRLVPMGDAEAVAGALRETLAAGGAPSGARAEMWNRFAAGPVVAAYHRLVTEGRSG